jgi:hypothetical protein
VNCAKLRLENRLNGFLFSRFPITRLKPGVNENLNLLFQSRALLSVLIGVNLSLPSQTKVVDKDPSTGS